MNIDDEINEIAHDADSARIILDKFINGRFPTCRSFAICYTWENEDETLGVGTKAFGFDTDLLWALEVSKAKLISGEWDKEE